ncbi:MAG: hypothetical protein M3340_19685 [Actinomycetota bacterium]|nr:hypothetical protein [Actinomycetota bacterium]
MKAAIAELVAAEERLAAGLERAREWHSDEHDVHHLSATLASISRAHVERLAPFAERYGAQAAQPSGRSTEAGSLLGDLRELYLLASDVSIGWTILGQGAQAARDEELLAVVSECHPDSLRQLKWVTTRIKEAAPQVLTG